MALLSSSLLSWDPAFLFHGGGQDPAQEEGWLAEAPGQVPDPGNPPAPQRGVWKRGSVWRLEIGSLRGAHIETRALSLAAQLAGDAGGSRDLELQRPPAPPTPAGGWGPQGSPSSSSPAGVPRLAEQHNLLGAAPHPHQMPTMGPSCSPTSQGRVGGRVGTGGFKLQTQWFSQVEAPGPESRPLDADSRAAREPASPSPTCLEGSPRPPRRKGAPQGMLGIETGLHESPFHLLPTGTRAQVRWSPVPHPPQAWVASKPKIRH